MASNVKKKSSIIVTLQYNEVRHFFSPKDLSEIMLLCIGPLMTLQGGANFRNCSMGVRLCSDAGTYNDQIYKNSFLHSYNPFFISIIPLRAGDFN